MTNPGPLADYRLVYIGPAFGQTSVGEYSDNMVRAVSPYFAEVVEYRTPGPGGASVADVLKARKAVAKLVAEGPPNKVLVHAELSTGTITPFWCIAGLRNVPVTGTIHDPPQGPWFVARTRFIGRSRLLTHGIHYPLRPVSRAVERKVYGDRTLFALTRAGKKALEHAFPRTHPQYIPIISFDRPPIRPVDERPKAVGLFGHVYRGKGFEHIARIREFLPEDITIRIAGRGTETLPSSPGIEVLGGVEGADQDAFFESVRAIVVPYGKRHWYAETYPASGVGASAQSYGTPVITTGYGSLSELDESTGAVTVQVKPEDDVARVLAGAITALVEDRDRLRALGANASRTGQERSRAGTGKAFTDVWARMLG